MHGAEEGRGVVQEAQDREVALNVLLRVAGRQLGHERGDHVPVVREDVGVHQRLERVADVGAVRGDVAREVAAHLDDHRLLVRVGAPAEHDGREHRAVARPLLEEQCQDAIEHGLDEGVADVLGLLLVLGQALEAQLVHVDREGVLQGAGGQGLGGLLRVGLVPVLARGGAAGAGAVILVAGGLLLVLVRVGPAFAPGALVPVAVPAGEVGLPVKEDAHIRGDTQKDLLDHPHVLDEDLAVLGHALGQGRAHMGVQRLVLVQQAGPEFAVLVFLFGHFRHSFRDGERKKERKRMAGAVENRIKKI